MDTHTGDVPVVSVKHVTKNFQAVTALRDVSIDFYQGKVHVLFGENGAGKSTLINVLSGVHQPTEGTVEIEGVGADLVSPQRARELGISSVFQEPALVGTLSVAENLTLGREHLRSGFLNRAQNRRAAEQALVQAGSTLSLDSAARDLSRADQQVVEIARALQGSAKLLILDEPTASLTEDETSRLFEVVRRLKAEGLAIIYITHRMGEIREIGDTVSVMRDGALIDTMEIQDVTDEELVTLMVGRKVESLFPDIPHNPREGGLELRRVSTSQLIDVTLTARRGEVVGVTGLVGSGKGDVGRSVFGLAEVLAGSITVDGEEIGAGSPEQRIQQEIIYYPSDRKRDGLIQTMAAFQNATLSALDSWTKFGFVNRKAERAAAEKVLQKMHLRPNHPESLPGTFSGGNQQKIVLARGFTRDYAIHVFDEPTAGVDVGARAEIYNAMQALAESGAAVLVISSDLPEVIGLVHRAYVISQGYVVGEFTGDELSQDNMLPYFFQEMKEPIS
ncbi:sugar ABC transporter ATP-binding protein [Leucobacter denitrificans]|uniref:Sugar ABC transporter ATP-binding protein n=1 Tax=Leucobacter denitrificans TaxID=683042 RepID=A0A7G9S767_9MICO|nr:sugar ABC transporter ATP-binding protein [Leucobacter denitrificans]QNN63692.1 sugar ABC transporter ATP-binding protein [Leucobacter denitrificans]